MTNEELKTAIGTLEISSSFDETGEFLTVLTDAKDLRTMMEMLRKKNEFAFDYLFCLTCVDWKDHLMMVYHLTSKIHNHTVVVKAKIADVASPAIDTVCDIWRTAELMEREVFDLFGVQFRNHPDLRRLFLDDNWQGYPLRKNYVDANMIKL